MRKLALIAALLCCAAGFVFAGGGGKLGFNKDHAKAMADAKLLGKPVVLYFTADW